MYKLTLLYPVVGFALVASVSATAFAQECYLSNECPGEQLCLDLVCTGGAELQPCDEDAQDDICDSDDLCHDGWCKPTGARCSNNAGSCTVRSNGGGCECADGNGVGWVNPDGGPEMTGPELYASCVDSLETHCGTNPPDLPESCTEQVLPACEGYVAHFGRLMAACGDDPSTWTQHALTKECCERFHDDGMAEFRACIQAIPTDVECQAERIRACSDLLPDHDDDDGDTSGDDEGDTGGETADPGSGETSHDPGDTSGNGDAKGDDDGVPSRGCTVTTQPGPGLGAAALLTLLGLGLRRTRTRRGN